MKIKFENVKNTGWVMTFIIGGFKYELNMEAYKDLPHELVSALEESKQHDFTIVPDYDEENPSNRSKNELIVGLDRKVQDLQKTILRQNDMINEKDQEIDDLKFELHEKQKNIEDMICQRDTFKFIAKEFSAIVSSMLNK